MNQYQEAELIVLKEIIKIFNKHNLNYFAIGGTCIGAIRHNGFIPWDDDIDIAMPRLDYELFRRKYYLELPEYIKKLDYDNSIHHDFLFFKIYDSNSTMVDNYAKKQPDRFTGAFVDIMPVDGLPNSLIDIKKLLMKSKLLIKLNTTTRLRSVFPRKNMGTIQYLKDCIKKIIGYVCQKLNIPELIEEVFSTFDYNNSRNICFTWRIGCVDYGRIVFNADYFRETILVPFENIMINIPKEFDLYLKQDFGNYMELPPMENRNSGHDAYIYDMTKPCSYYAEIERNKK